MEHKVANGKRIECFDLMKGVVITLVVLAHCIEQFPNDFGGTKLWEMLEHLRMPLYFFLSGIFFKEYSGIVEFTIKKINKLLLPCAFFAILRIIPDTIIGHVTFEVDSIRHFITWSIKTQGGYWFLISLFFVNELHYLCKLAASKVSQDNQKVFEALFVCMLVAIGWRIAQVLGMNLRDERTIIFNLIAALLALPFFYIAHQMKDILQKIANLKLYSKIGLALALLLCWCVTARGGVYLVKAWVENNIVLFYVSAISAILFVYIICEMLKKLPVISYFGRYSIVIYTTHILVIIGLREYLHTSVAMFAVVIVLMPAFIWFFTKYFPYFTAQKELLIYRNRRVVLNINRK